MVRVKTHSKGTSRSMSSRETKMKKKLIELMRVNKKNDAVDFDVSEPTKARGYMKGKREK